MAKVQQFLVNLLEHTQSRMLTTLPSVNTYNYSVPTKSVHRKGTVTSANGEKWTGRGAHPHGSVSVGDNNGLLVTRQRSPNDSLQATVASLNKKN